MREKSLNTGPQNPAVKIVSDLKVFGNPDQWRLLCKASSKKEGWMKSTKAMQIHGVGCVLQVTTQQGENVSEAVTFIPNTKILFNDSTEKTGGRLVHNYCLDKQLLT